MSYRVDLTGNRFGKLEVVGFDSVQNRWKCLCDCQKNSDSPQYTYVKTKYLNNGSTKSCGCLHREKMFTDITNKRFGKLVALLLHHRDDNGRAYWLCKCDCGSEVIVPVKSLTLTKGGKKSCGHCLGKEMIGKKYGKLTVLGFAYTKNRKNYWECRCECGNKTYVSTNSLNSGNTTSCGDKTHKQREGVPRIDITGQTFGWLTAIRYVGNSRWLFKCNNCGKYKEIHGSDVTCGKTSSCGCKNVIISGSKAENEIKAYVQSLLPEAEIKKVKILNGKEIDIYIPSLKLGIEYNGSAYHASENSLFRNHDKYYHRDKFLEARKQGINLITVFDKDYEEGRYKILTMLQHVVFNSFVTFLPRNNIEYTNNDFGVGDWIKEFGYKEIGQEEPDSFTYQGKYAVYRCGRTIWEKVLWDIK